MRPEDYAIRIEPLPREEGGGIPVIVPDLPGCVAGGETIEAAYGPMTGAGAVKGGVDLELTLRNLCN